MTKYLLPLLLLLALPVRAATILNSIKPLEMITYELILTSDSSSSLLSQNASPHDYALKPSDIQKIQSADLIVWVGSDLEVFLAKPIAKSRRSLALANNENMPLRTFTKPCGCGHKHSHYDPHIWLGPEQAKIIAQSITSELIKISPDLKLDYLSKLQQFNQTLSQTVERIKQQLTPSNTKVTSSFTMPMVILRTILNSTTSVTLPFILNALLAPKVNYHQKHH